MQYAGLSPKGSRTDGGLAEAGTAGQAPPWPEWPREQEAASEDPAMVDVV